LFERTCRFRVEKSEMMKKLGGAVLHRSLVANVENESDEPSEITREGLFYDLRALRKLSNLGDEAACSRMNASGLARNGLLPPPRSRNVGFREKRVDVLDERLILESLKENLVFNTPRQSGTQYRTQGSALPDGPSLTILCGEGRTLFPLFTPYRISAPRPNEPEAPEADAYEATLRRRSIRTRKIVTAVVGIIGSVSLLAYAESPAPKKKMTLADAAELRSAARAQEARSIIANARVEALQLQQQFSETVLRSLDDAAAEPSTTPCPLVFPEATHLIHGQQAFPLLIVNQGDRDLPSPSVSTLMMDINRAEDHFANGRTLEGILYANALTRKTPGERLRYDVVLVATTLTHPSRTSSSEFKPGEISGRAYVYDFVEHRVTCAGNVQAKSSRQIEYNYVPAVAVGAPAGNLSQDKSLSTSLDVDLEIQTQNAIRNGPLFRVVGN